MQPKPQPTKPKRPVPSLNDLKQQKASADSTATGKQPKPKVPAPVLTPEQKIEKEKKEQEKIKAINDDWKKELTPQEQDEALKAIEKIAPGNVVNGVVQPCTKKAKNIYCVPPSGKVGFSQDLKDAVKKNAAGTGKDAKDVKVNYDQLAAWEGGSYSGAYVPWGPKIQSVKKDIGEEGKPNNVSILVPSTEHDVDKAGKTGTLKGWKVGKYNNSSGVTVGTGVDLGAQSEAGLGNDLKKAAKESGLLTDKEAQDLVDKLKPYFGKKRTDACQALRKNPLTLTQKETDLVNYVTLSKYTKEAITEYEQKTGKAWNDLSEQEQTLILSKKYHTGSVPKALAKDVSADQSDAVTKALKGSREESYMQKYYKEQAAAAEKAKAQAPKAGGPKSTTTGPAPTPGPH